MGEMINFDKYHGGFYHLPLARASKNTKMDFFLSVLNYILYNMSIFIKLIMVIGPTRNGVRTLKKIDNYYLD